jgi:hypothetical protein
MDSVTTIRVVAGIIAVILLVILVARRKRVATTKRPGDRR